MRKSQLYLWEDLRKRYIKQLTDIKELFFERILPAFNEIENEAQQYAEDFFEHAFAPEHFDPFDVAYDAEMAGLEKFEMLSLMRYRTIGMWISLICQVWEQQIHTFVLDEARKERITYKEEDIKKGFIFAKGAFLLHGVDFETLPCWGKVKEMRLLVNVIKHAEGDSANALRVLRPDLFQFYDAASDSLKLYNSTLLEITLNISEEDFNNYYKSLVEFWSALPERMFEQ